eukprot:6492166-Amphidinium_carterae.4
MGLEVPNGPSASQVREKSMVTEHHVDTGGPVWRSKTTRICSLGRGCEVILHVDIVAQQAVVPRIAGV